MNNTTAFELIKGITEDTIFIKHFNLNQGMLAGSYLKSGKETTFNLGAEESEKFLNGITVIANKIK